MVWMPGLIRHPAIPLFLDSGFHRNDENGIYQTFTQPSRVSSTPFPRKAKGLLSPEILFNRLQCLGQTLAAEAHPEGIVIRAVQAAG